MEIIINKDECVENLHKQSAHLALKLGAPEYLASTDEDRARIEPLLNAALGELFHLLSHYAQLFNDRNLVRCILSMPPNWKDNQLSTLSELCNEYVQQELFARWLDFVKADSAVLYRTLNQNTVSAIKHILSLRKKPERTV